MNNFSDWVDEVVKNKINAEKESKFTMLKEAVGNTRQDLSRPVLEDLMGQGYTIVQWNSGSSTHGQCLELNNQQWMIQDFLSGLAHDAPIFERSHPGDKSCTLVVSGEGLPQVVVDSFGNIQEI